MDRTVILEGPGGRERHGLRRASPDSLRVERSRVGRGGVGRTVVVHPRDRRPDADAHRIRRIRIRPLGRRAADDRRGRAGRIRVRVR